MESKNVSKKYCLFVGRYQTVHEGHLYIFRRKIEEGKNVLVAIRDVEVDEKNIYNANHVKCLFMLQKEVRRWINKGFMKIIIIPDIEAICYGRDVGYKIEQIEVPKEIAEISATKLRAEKLKNEEGIN
jgi:phosphopantetheine adenylyltransferase